MKETHLIGRRDFVRVAKREDDDEDEHEETDDHQELARRLKQTAIDRTRAAGHSYLTHVIE